MRKDLHEENRVSWNAATVAHNSHKGDQAALLRNGGSTLYPEEIAALELNLFVAGQFLLHCHSEGFPAGSVVTDVLGDGHEDGFVT